MADKLFFRQGTLAQLNNATPLAGAIDFTTDEPALYLNVSNGESIERKRIGDIKEFPNLTEFQEFLTDNTEEGSSIPNIPTTGLYYIVDTNSLLKFTGKADDKGETWIQINAQAEIDTSDFLTADSDTITTLKADVQTNQQNIAALQNTVQTLSENDSEIEGRLVVVEELLDAGETGEDTGTIAGRLNSLEINVSSLNEIVNGVEASEGNEAKTGLVDDVESLKTRVENVEGKVADAATKGELETLTNTVNGKADTGTVEGINSRLQTAEGSITGLSATVGEHTASITGINESIQGIQQDIATINDDLLKKADSDTLNEVKETADAAATQESVTELSGKVTAAEGKIGELETQVGTNKTNIETLQGQLAQVDNQIDTKIKAANAMNYIGVITTDDNSEVIYPEGNIHAGDTWVAGKDLYIGDTLAYAGDLIIASGTEINGIIPNEGIDWNIVKTGYQDAHDQFININENKIQLNSFDGEVNSSVEIAGEDNIVISTNESNNKITISLEWGTFGE